GLIESRNPRHPAEQKRKQGYVLLLRDFGIDRAKALRVGNPVVGRRLHLDERDLRPGLLRLDGCDQRFEIRARLFWRETAKSVVRAALDHDQIHWSAQYPVYAPHRSRRRLSRQTGIHHLDWNTLGLRFLL